MQKARKLSDGFLLNSAPDGRIDRLQVQPIALRR
jgi:hypothetical protein